MGLAFVEAGEEFFPLAKVCSDSFGFVLGEAGRLVAGMAGPQIAVAPFTFSRDETQVLPT